MFYCDENAIAILPITRDIEGKMIPAIIAANDPLINNTLSNLVRFWKYLVKATDLTSCGFLAFVNLHKHLLLINYFILLMLNNIT